MRNLFFFLLFSLITNSSLFAQNTASQEFQLANEAYKAEDYPAFLSHLKNANELRPNHRTILYNLAEAYTLNDKFTEAIETLEYRASFYAINDFSEDEKLVPIREFPAFKKLLLQIEQNNKPIQNSTVHFEIEDPGFHPEGIAVHPNTGNFLVSDVRCGLIYDFDKTNFSKNLLLDLKELGFWGAMGMAFDKNNPDLLWVATSALPSYCEYSDSLNGKSAVLKIDLQNGSLVQSYSVEGNHVFGDLITTQSGTVYISDSFEPVLYRITKEKNELEVFLEPTKLFNLQGLALGDENMLYISDYITGVYSVDLSSKKTTPVIAETQLTRGTDGLYFSDGQLYLMQNGTRPFQVAKIDLSNSSLEIIDRAVPELNEPTLGIIHNGVLYFVSNSPWAFYGENNNPMINEWPILQIRKLNIRK
jgi:hypothetical protein